MNGDVFNGNREGRKSAGAAHYRRDGRVHVQLRIYGFAAALRVLLSGNATAAFRDDGSRNGVERFFSQIKQNIVQILDDIRPTLPPG